MKLTNRTIGRLWNALHELDGEKQTEASAALRFEFKGTVLYAIARTINHLRGQQAVVETTSQAIVRKHAGGKPGLSPVDPAFPVCAAEIDQLLDAEVEVEVHRVKLADLNLDKNHLKPTTLAGLEPIIEE
jgi:hypothetical protein